MGGRIGGLIVAAMNSIFYKKIHYQTEKQKYCTIM